MAEEKSLCRYLRRPGAAAPAPDEGPGPALQPAPT